MYHILYHTRVLFNMTICFFMLKLFNNAYYTRCIYKGSHMNEMKDVSSRQKQYDKLNIT